MHVQESVGVRGLGVWLWGWREGLSLRRWRGPPLRGSFPRGGLLGPGVDFLRWAFPVLLVSPLEGLLGEGMTRRGRGDGSF